MRKLVLGIIGLVAVQFAFVTYVMVLQSRMELTNDLIQAKPNPGNPGLVRIDHSNNPAVVLEPEVVVSPTEPRHTRATGLAVKVPEQVAKPDRSLANLVAKPAFNASQSKPAFDPAQSRAAAPEAFKSVVISYSRDPEASDCEIHDIPKPKKRSFIARASPVVRKPWEWIKAVGSKLN